MKLAPLHASLLALATIAAAGSAHAAADNAQPLVLAQADNGEAAAEFEQLRKFLAKGADVSRLDDERLQQRLSRAKRFQQMEGLPPDLAGELDQQIAAMTAEAERRQQAAAEAPADQSAEKPQQEVTDQQQAAPEQQKQVAEEAPPPQQESPEVAAFLNSVRPASELSADELRQQMERAAELAKAGDLSKDQRRALKDVIREARAELRNKKEAQQAETPQPPAAEQQQVQPEQPKQAEQTAAPQQQESPEVAAFLRSVKPASELSEDALRQQMERAVELAKTADLPQDQRSALRDVIREARAELRNKTNAQQTETPQPPAAEQQVQPELSNQTEQTAAPQPPQAADDVKAFLSSVKPASELSEEALRQQMQRATELAATEGLSAEQRQALRDVIREARSALRNTGGDNQQTGQQTPSDTQQQQAGQQTQPPAAQVDPELEAKALAIVNDKVDVTTMDRRDLRQRLSGIRDLLASNKLSPQTTEALRQKLAAERQVLRNEVSESESNDRTPQDNETKPNEAKPADGKPQDQAKDQTKGQGGGSTENNNVTINNTTTNNTVISNTEIRVVLQDRRPSDALDEEELVRRIDVYREVVDDESYAEDERIAWERELARDRRELRRRMLEERRLREDQLRDAEINIDIGERYDPDREVPDDVFAAEVDDQELTDVLAAPPRRKVQRRYTVEEIQRSPEARDSVARIEIDTVHFDFGEGFLREEEIDKLDRIAQVLERILAKNPGEVFMIEGHTDAVGSDASNMVLSRQRAQAVKEALTTYYVIPAANLKTVGLGERYLKIPTQQAEAENRRVSLARITPLVGQLD